MAFVHGKIDNNRWRIDRQGSMRTSGREETGFMQSLYKFTG
jgi:hypothetical protein